jgi:hypothetical protein
VRSCTASIAERVVSRAPAAAPCTRSLAEAIMSCALSAAAWAPSAILVFMEAPRLASP